MCVRSSVPRMPCWAKNAGDAGVARTRIAQNFNVPNTVLVDAGLIREERDALATHEADAVGASALPGRCSLRCARPTRGVAIVANGSRNPLGRGDSAFLATRRRAYCIR